jgi:membrane associated rhomboid family serine protease
MTAFSPRADVLAHLGGFVFGALLGLAAPLSPWRNSVQVSAAMTTALIMTGAWILALHQ